MRDRRGAWAAKSCGAAWRLAATIVVGLAVVQAHSNRSEQPRKAR